MTILSTEWPGNEDTAPTRLVVTTTQDTYIMEDGITPSTLPVNLRNHAIATFRGNSSEVTKRALAAARAQ